MYYNYHNKFLKYYNKTLKYQIGGDNISKINKFIAKVSFILFIVFSHIITKRTAYKTAKLLEQKLQDCTIDIPNLIDELIKYYDKLSLHSFTKTLIYMLNKTINFESLNELYTSVNKCQFENNSEEKIHLQKSYRSLVNKGSKIIDVSYKNNKIETITYDFDKAILKLSMIKLILYTIKYCDSIKYQKIINVICEQITVSKNKSKDKEKLRKRDIIKLLPIIKVYHYKNISNIKMKEDPKAEDQKTKEDDRKTTGEDRKTTVEDSDEIIVNKKAWTLFTKIYPGHDINRYLTNGVLYKRDCGGGGDCMFYAIAEILNNSGYVFTYPNNAIHGVKKDSIVKIFDVPTLREILADFFIDVEFDVKTLNERYKYRKYRNYTVKQLSDLYDHDLKIEKQVKEIKDYKLSKKDEYELLAELPQASKIELGLLEHYIASKEAKERGFNEWNPKDITTLKMFQDVIKKPGIVWGDFILLTRLQDILGIYFIVMTLTENRPIYCGTIDTDDFLKIDKKIDKKIALILNHEMLHYEALGYYDNESKKLLFLFDYDKIPEGLKKGYTELC